MHIPLNGKSRSFAGLSDLTVLAPIRQGLVPSLDSVTYKSRLRRLMEVLQLLRQASHEYAPFRPVSDAAERVGRIHSFRVAIVEPEDKLLLAVTFDGARESYIRVLWQKIGNLLDLLFCNTEGHVPAYGRSMAEWDAWIDRIQVKTDFFYGRPRHTSEDVQFLRDEAEQQQQALPTPAAALASVRRSMATHEMDAWRLANGPSLAARAETGRQGVQTVALLHRLTAWFIPGTPDGDFLHRAARDLLPEFVELIETTHLMDAPLSLARDRFGEALDWFQRPYAPRRVPARPSAAPGAVLKAAVQGGILETYRQVTHGALLLMAFQPGADHRPFWRAVQARCASAANQPSDGRTVWNVALTHEGLRAAGLTEAELAEFPLEFRQGMEERAGLLGDFWGNHPDRWRRPRSLRTGQALEMRAVHVVVQLRCGQGSGMPPGERIYDVQNPAHPLHQDIQELGAALGGCMELLSIESMVRHHAVPADPTSPIVEHFGYADGNAQPELDPAKVAADAAYPDNLVHPGEFLVGEANAADPAAGQGVPEVSAWLRHGSFLVLRKLSQDVPMFRRILEQGAADTGLPEEDVAGKLAGRRRDGSSLVSPPAAGNDFTFDGDPAGSACPFHAHIRRANPRLAGSAERPVPPEGLGLPRVPAGGRPPRIMRRGMSYGAPFDPQDAEASAEVPRGVYFMAYNARIAEQFEVIQRWLAGGNSTGGFSGHTDPLTGIAPAGERRSFVFEQDGQAHRVALDGNDDVTTIPASLVRLEWGAYLFTPSIAALQAFEQRAARIAEGTAQTAWPWSVERGRAAIARLLAMEGDDADRVAAWKAALEDPEALKDFSAASIWAAVRHDHGGVLRTPYGVLAASHARASGVLSDPSRLYSVAGYRDRAAPTLGDLYLGLDDLGPGCPYRERATVPNQAIRTITRQQAFDAARALTRQALEKLVGTEQANARNIGEPVWRLTFAADEVWDEVLEGLCRQWFGLPAGGPHMKAGRFTWDWRPGQAVPYPGHFLSPSRYIFQPQPGHEVARLGSLHGTAVNAAFRDWVKALRDQGAVPPGPLGQAFFDAFPRTPGASPQQWAAQDEQVAVVLLGALIGFLPTVQGNLRQSLNEWLLDGRFWALRAGLQGRPATAADVAAIRDELLRSMMLRPSPEVVWRRATRDHALGAETVHGGDTVVVSIVSALHERLEQGQLDTDMVFGGWTTGPGVPTHACPGRDAARGTLLGILTGLLECGEALRPTAFPLGFRAEGPTPQFKPDELRTLKAHPAVSPVVPVAAAVPPGGLRTAAHRILAAAAPRKLRLITAGDSWFDYAFGSDLADELKRRKELEVTNQGVNGTRLAAFAGQAGVALANDGSGVGRICRLFLQLAGTDREPDAIVLSAGGNDVVDDVIKRYVRDISDRNLTAAQVKALIASDGEFDNPAFEALMDGPAGVMRGQVMRVLDKLGQHCRRADGRPVPVLWQGYDHPVPDGRIPFLTVERNPLSVLWAPLTELGFKDAEDRVAIMKKVVDRYNHMLAGMSAGPYKGQLVHADLRDTLDATLANKAYKKDWVDELHATGDGCVKLVDRLFTRYLGPLLPSVVAPGPLVPAEGEVPVAPGVAVPAVAVAPAAIRTRRRST
jgi:deferrochelatase/peroxidase EfeB